MIINSQNQKKIAIKVFILLNVIFLLLSFIITQSYAKEPSVEMSLQGFTGLLNTPNAELTREGTAELQRNTERNISLSEKTALNMILSFGLFSNIELSGRIWEQDSNYDYGDFYDFGMRDVSVNFKLLLLDGKDSLAVGSQDFGGGATNFKTTYLVGSKIIGPTRFSMGYGTGPDRMKGTFGGLEWTIFENLDLIAEHDTKDNNLGLRIRTSKDWIGHGIKVGFIAKQAINSSYHKQFEYGLGLTIPFWNNHYLEKPLTLTNNHYPPPKLLSNLNKENAVNKISENKKQNVINPYGLLPLNSETKNKLLLETNPKDKDNFYKKLEKIGNKLIDLGLENVRVGFSDNVVYVEYENHRYNHNELDALGLVMGVTAVETPESLNWMVVLVKKDNLPVIEIKIPTEGYRDFLMGPKDSNKLSVWPISVGSLWSKMTISNVNNSLDYYNVQWIDLNQQNNPWARITLFPAVPSYFLATEFNLLDYALVWNSEIEMPIWKGGVLNTAWSLPLSHSKNLEEGNVFGRFFPEPEIYNLWLQQGTRPSSNVFNLTGLGMNRLDKTDYFGLYNDISWIPNSGDHRLFAELGYFRNFNETDNQPYWKNQKQRTIAMASYRYFYTPLDLALDATIGKFWFKDHGIVLKGSRFFGDVSITLYYIQTKGGQTSEVGLNDRVAGLTFGIPLTPRQDMKPGLVQVKGNERWYMGLETTIAKQGQANYLNPDLAIAPSFTRSINRNYINYGRLSPSYIRNHILRLREAYARWGQEH